MGLLKGRSSSLFHNHQLLLGDNEQHESSLFLVEVIVPVKKSICILASCSYLEYQEVLSQSYGGREGQEAEELMGRLFNTVPACTDMSFGIQMLLSFIQ